MFNLSNNASNVDTALDEHCFECRHFFVYQMCLPLFLISTLYCRLNVSNIASNVNMLCRPNLSTIALNVKVLCWPNVSNIASNVDTILSSKCVDHCFYIKIGDQTKVESEIKKKFDRRRKLIGKCHYNSSARYVNCCSFN